MEKPYLFSFKAWHGDPLEYILVYGIDEEDARKKGVKNLRYNCGEKPKPENLGLCTIF